jgi:hypothetical protein
VSRGFGNSGSSAHSRSVFILNLPEHTLTPCCIGREGVGDTTLWGHDSDIDIKGEFVFSQNFYLTGPDSEAITKLFNKSLVGFFRTHSMLFDSGTLDVKPNAIVFTHARPLMPEDIRATLDVLLKLIALLSADSK